MRVGTDCGRLVASLIPALARVRSRLWLRLAHFPLIQEHLDEKTPSYICFKLDTTGWLFIAYVPDFAKVRDKMLYASTRAALKKNLGEPHFVDELYGLDKVCVYAEGRERVAKGGRGVRKAGGRAKRASRATLGAKRATRATRPCAEQLFCMRRATLLHAHSDSFACAERLFCMRRTQLPERLGPPSCPQRDLTLEAYHKHKQSAAATAPLTEREEEVQRLRKEEVGIPSCDPRAPAPPSHPTPTPPFLSPTQPPTPTYPPHPTPHVVSPTSP